MDVDFLEPKNFTNDAISFTYPVSRVKDNSNNYLFSLVDNNTNSFFYIEKTPSDGFSLDDIEKKFKTSKMVIKLLILVLLMLQE